MSTAPRSPLDGAERVVVDGTNLLHRMGAGTARTGSAEILPPAAIIGRIRAVIPATVQIDLVFDGAGHGVYGRVAQKMLVRFSGRRTADETILDLASEAVLEGGGGPMAASRVLVVTDDRDLRLKLLAKGVRTAPTHWLLNRLHVPAAAGPAPANRHQAIGAGRPRTGAPGSPNGVRGGARGGAGGADGGADEDRRGWKPGRGATAKTGPAKKVARHKRHPRMG